MRRDLAVHSATTPTAAKASRLRTFVLVLMASIVISIAATPVLAATFVVDDDGTYNAATDDCDGSDPSFTVIQAAVDAAANGDTILVCPGTYNESQIFVTKRLTLQGSGAAVTIIDGGGGFGVPLQGMIRLIPGAGTGDLVFDGFTVRNPRATTSESASRINLFVGSAFDVNIIITNNIIIGSGDPAHNLNYTVYASGPVGGQPAIDTFIFQHNEVRDSGSNTILIERHVGPTDVSYNTFDRGVRTAGITAYVNMSHSGSVISSLQRVSYNTINMANDPGPYTIANASSAIGFIGGLTGSTVGSFTNVEIVGNTITGLESYRRGIQLANNISSLVNTANGTISNAVISCNTMSGPAGSPQEGSIGIRLVGNIPSPSISNNAISAVDIGFRAENVTNGVASGVVLSENSFVDTDTFAVDWRSTEIIDAERNWWGSASGPTEPSNPGGTGGVIGAGGGPVGSGVIDYSPWLASGTDGDVGPCFEPAPSGECVDVGTCDEIDGCAETPLPDGSTCGGGLYTCSSGSCGGTLSPIVLSRTTLRTNSSTIRPNGRVTAAALLNDNDTSGGFLTALLAGQVSVQVSDSGDFDVTRTLTNCVEKRALIRCLSADRRTKANFLYRPRGPYLYTMLLTLSGVEASETGPSLPLGPATVVLNQGLATRTDTIGDFTACKPLGKWNLFCRER